jgi:hypothetical protein
VTLAVKNKSSVFIEKLSIKANFENLVKVGGNKITQIDAFSAKSTRSVTYFFRNCQRGRKKILISYRIDDERFIASDNVKHLMDLNTEESDLRNVKYQPPNFWYKGNFEIFSLNILGPLDIKNLQNVSQRCLTHIKKFYVFSNFSVKEIFGNFVNNFGFWPFLKIYKKGQDAYLEEDSVKIGLLLDMVEKGEYEGDLGLIAFFVDFEKVVLSLELSWIMKSKGNFDLFMILKAEELGSLVELLRFKQDRVILRKLFGLRMMAELD